MNVDAVRANWFQERIIKWGLHNIDIFPWRETNEPVLQLTAEVLLQRTRAEQVVAVFNDISQSYWNIEKLSSLSLDEIRELIHRLGLHWRAKKLYELFSVISHAYNGCVPLEYDSLIELPGIGPYSASAFLSLHQGIRKPIIDSNVVRVYGRFFGFEYGAETRRKKWLHQLANELTPKVRFCAYNYALIDFARKVCTRSPSHRKCPIRKHCDYVYGSANDINDVV
jgi:A/G-specific adenine glycosylase